jgi:hypothetical protein
MSPARGALRSVHVAPSQSDPEEWLLHYDDKYLACRMAHDWPRLVPHRRLIRTTIEAMPAHLVEGRQGVSIITQRCGNCGRLRWRLTGPRGVAYDPNQNWHYRDPHGYAQPKGMGIAKAQFVAEFWRRIIEETIT